jgi:hypothetical protein
LNSAGNPLLYAYHLTDFRVALKGLLFGPSPEGREHSAFAPDLHHKTHIVYSLPTPKMPHRILSPEGLPELPGMEHPSTLFRIVTEVPPPLHIRFADETDPEDEAPKLPEVTEPT